MSPFLRVCVWVVSVWIDVCIGSVCPVAAHIGNHMNIFNFEIIFIEIFCNIFVERLYSFNRRVFSDCIWCWNFCARVRVLVRVNVWVYWAVNVCVGFVLDGNTHAYELHVRSWGVGRRHFGLVYFQQFNLPCIVSLIFVRVSCSVCLCLALPPIPNNNKIIDWCAHCTQYTMYAICRCVYPFHTHIFV